MALKSKHAAIKAFSRNLRDEPSDEAHSDDDYAQVLRQEQLLQRLLNLQFKKIVHLV